MPTVIEDLRSISSLRALPAEEFTTTVTRWVRRNVAPGSVLWEAGDAAEGLGVLIAGELSVEMDGVPVGTVWSGEVLGEASTIVRKHVRTATLRAVKPSRVLMLLDSDVQELRSAGSPLYAALLNLAEHALVRRIHEADHRLAQLAPGTDKAPAREHRTGLLRLLNGLRPGLPLTPCPPIEPLLRVQPGLGSVEPEIIAAIAEGFTQEAMSAGTVLFLEGEPATSAWLVAEGEVGVWRNVRHGKAEKLTRLGPARLLGVNALIERGARAASCVATTPCWLYRMDGIEGYKHLHGAALRAWQESLLGSLTSQIRTVDDLLENVALDVDTPPVSADAWVPVLTGKPPPRSYLPDHREPPTVL